MHPSGSICAVAIVVCASACSPSARWEVKLEPDLAASRQSVSVFGVYKDGQMSPEAWAGLRPRFEPILGGRECAIASGELRTGSPLSTAIDDYARTNGPTDALLAQLAPAAAGDLILVLVEAGGVSPEEHISVVNSSASGPGPSTTPGSAGLSDFAPKKHPGGARRDVLQLSASLFSVAQGRSVGLIDMKYTGDSVDAAVSEFTARVGKLLPGSTCKGWDWHAAVDPERIRGITAEE